jgi:hypothetical protein
MLQEERSKGGGSGGGHTQGQVGFLMRSSAAPAWSSKQTENAPPCPCRRPYHVVMIIHPATRPSGACVAAPSLGMTGSASAAANWRKVGRWDACSGPRPMANASTCAVAVERSPVEASAGPGDGGARPHIVRDGHFRVGASAATSSCNTPQSLTIVSSRTCKKRNRVAPATRGATIAGSRHSSSRHYLESGEREDADHRHDSHRLPLKVKQRRRRRQQRGRRHGAGGGAASAAWGRRARKRVDGGCRSSGDRVGQPCAQQQVCRVGAVQITHVLRCAPLLCVAARARTRRGWDK